MTFSDNLVIGEFTYFVSNTSQVVIVYKRCYGSVGGVLGLDLI